MPRRLAGDARGREPAGPAADAFEAAALRVFTAHRTAAVLVLALLAACAEMEPAGAPPDLLEVPYSRTPDSEPVSPRGTAPTAMSATAQATQVMAAPTTPRVTIRRGGGQFVRPIEPVAPAASGDGSHVVNFRNAELADVVKVVLGDLLGRTYVLDPRVKGKVTVQTSRPLDDDGLWVLLESVLATHAAVLLDDGGVFRILPAADAAKAGLAPRLAGDGPLPPGFGIRVVPLRHVGAAEMRKVLDPLLPSGRLLHVDEQRNLLVLAGTRSELDDILHTVETFDVDWLAGMSVALFTLQQAGAAGIARELTELFGPDVMGPSADPPRFVPVERINTLMVIARKAETLRRVGTWVRRLDQDQGYDTRRFHVYRVENGSAEPLATMLETILESGVAELAPVALAPGSTAATITAPAEGPGDALPEDTIDVAAAPGGDIRIFADRDNNALVIYATTEEFDQISGLLAQLDLPRRQVLVEATIAEVLLTGELRYGIQWYFQNNIFNDKTGTASLDLNTDVELNDVLGQGFTYAISDSAGLVRGLLRTLATESRVNILSSPQLMVLDNQTADIRIGDQIPVRSSTTITDGGVTTESIEYRDTGVLLTVTPRTNATGLVTMAIDQEVTTLGEVEPTTGQRRFLQRTVNSNVAVQSGQTLVLGGLINTNRSFGNSGFPVVRKIPVLGALFGTTVRDVTRAELVILITPTVVHDQNQVRAVTQEIRRRLKGIRMVEREQAVSGDGNASGAPAVR